MASVNITLLYYSLYLSNSFNSKKNETRKIPKKKLSINYAYTTDIQWQITHVSCIQSFVLGDDNSDLHSFTADLLTCVCVTVCKSTSASIRVNFSIHSVPSNTHMNRIDSNRHFYLLQITRKRFSSYDELF